MVARPLSKELQEIAIRELNEDPDRIQNDLRAIREWAEEQPHLKIRTDDQWLLSFLRCCKYNLDVTKQKLDWLCTIKTFTPEFFANRDPLLPEIQELLKLGVILPLPKTAHPAAPRVILLRIGLFDLTKYRLVDGIRLGLMILDILANEDDNCIVAGCHILGDNKDLAMSHVFQGAMIAPKFYKCLNDAYIIKPRGIHGLNVPPFAETSFNMSKAMVDEELINLVHFYNDTNIETLYESIPLSVLPAEYDGNGGSLDDIIAEWKEKVESYREWFLEDAQYCADETKRPKLSTTHEDLTNLGIFDGVRSLVNGGRFVDTNELD